MEQKRKIQQIKSYFNGQLSGKEEQELFTWIKSDEQNRTFFNAEKAKLNSGEIKHELLESSFNELKTKLNFKSSKKSGKKVFLYLARVAAFVVLLVSLSITLSLVIFNQSKPDEIVWFETTAPRGEKSKIELPDGSKVWLNSETTIRYPNNFANDNRQIQLIGEAYFEVEKFKEMPFVVKTNDYSINVLGTKFNVMAYPDFNRTQTALIEGKIQIEKDGNVVDIKPGEEITFEINRFTIRETNTSLSKVWKDNKFDFDQIPIPDLVKRLERWYDVDIIINGNELPEYTYSGVFKNEETIWQVLDVLQISVPFTYKRIDFRKIEITPNL